MEYVDAIRAVETYDDTAYRREAAVDDSATSSQTPPVGLHSYGVAVGFHEHGVTLVLL